MSKPNALVVAVRNDDGPFHTDLLDAVVRGLDDAWRPQILDLTEVGFVPFMSAAERTAYHTDTPVVDPMVAEHVDLIDGANALIFVFPTRWWQPPALLKAWLERVFVPGVAFVFNENHRVRPNLGQLQALAGVTTYNTSARSLRRVGDGGRRMVLRAMRANIPHRVSKSWSGLKAFDAATAEQKATYLADVERHMARL